MLLANNCKIKFKMDFMYNRTKNIKFLGVNITYIRSLLSKTFLSKIKKN